MRREGYGTESVAGGPGRRATGLYRSFFLVISGPGGIGYQRLRGSQRVPGRVEPLVSTTGIDPLHQHQLGRLGFW